MNIIEACRLLYSFCGFAQQKRRFDSEIYLNGCLEVMDGALDNPNQKYQNYKPSLADILDDRWLYYNDKFECLTCETCYKLLNDMEGLAPVCECATGVKIGDTVKITAKDVAMMHSIKCQQCDKYKKSPSDNVEWCKCNKFGGENIDWAIVDDGYIERDVNDDALLYEFIKDCQIDGVLYRAGERVLWKKSKAKFKEESGIVEIASNNPYWPPRVSAQYPGMIEVNYLDRNSKIVHYRDIQLNKISTPISRQEREYLGLLRAHGKVEYKYIALIRTDGKEISEQEYHRILNLFKASGLEVSK